MASVTGSANVTVSGTLVWFQIHADFASAIAREKPLKNWKRVWKVELIENGNPQWRDLWQKLE